ncbi:hypothetical protein [Moraxella bovoculi]|uniref:hypothetical protein n=1 Tax=Moraxella bovoculi TaxID=386891 RepID=UPI000B201335|nr:hypothetical protein [Moraxella bovoculi]
MQNKTIQAAITEFGKIFTAVEYLSDDEITERSLEYKTDSGLLITVSIERRSGE